MTLRLLIVDDEPLARAGLRDELAAHPDVEIIGECGDGRSALATIRRTRPDVVLLDIQMPELDGMQLVQRLGTQLPAVIFVTAHDRHAVAAFEAHAVDYLLKPVAPERLREALARTRSRLAEGRHDLIVERLERLLAELPQPTRYARQLAPRTGGQVNLVPVDEIDWIEAARNYATLHVGTGRYLLRETFNTLERRLDPEQFVRVHRSAIVNVSRIREILPSDRSDYVVVLRDGARIPLTRTYRDRLP